MFPCEPIRQVRRRGRSGCHAASLLGTPTFCKTPLPCTEILGPFIRQHEDQTVLTAPSNRMALFSGRGGLAHPRLFRPVRQGGRGRCQPYLLFSRLEGVSATCAGHLTGANSGRPGINKNNPQAFRLSGLYRLASRPPRVCLNKKNDTKKRLLQSRACDRPC